MFSWHLNSHSRRFTFTRKNIDYRCLEIFEAFLSFPSLGQKTTTDFEKTFFDRRSLVSSDRSYPTAAFTYTEDLWKPTRMLFKTSISFIMCAVRVRRTSIANSLMRRHERNRERIFAQHERRMNGYYTQTPRRDSHLWQNSHFTTSCVGRM